MADVPAADPAPPELEGIFFEFFNKTQRLRDTFEKIVTRALKLPPGLVENRSDSKAVGIRLPNYLLNRLRKQVKEFFAQPAAYKVKFDRGMGYGYGGYIGYKG